VTLSRIGFACNPYAPNVGEVLARGRAWCEARSVEAWDSTSEEVDALARMIPGSDVVFVLGGDGTFLRTARAIGDSAVPALGVNLGRIGFLAKVETSGLERALEQVERGEYRVEERFRVAATLERADGTSERHICLNEVVVARGQVVRMLQVEVQVSGSHLATYLADGVLVATPTGSTAYSFSAGGAILDPRLRNMIITPVASYLSALRSVVAGADQVVSLTLLDTHGQAIISFDGQLDRPLAIGDRVDVRAHPTPFRLIELAGSVPFYDLLREKAALLPS
jgi:NAD+ kinase